MKICIYYESLTGNTRQIAQAIQEACPSDVIYCGPYTPQAADLYFIGSWTNKGDCGDMTQTCLKELKNAKIAYFGTCGFGGSDDYYESLFQRMLIHMDSSCEIIGHFYCPGKMPAAIKERYISLLQAHPEDQKLQVSLQNFEDVKDRPNEQDLKDAKTWALKMIQEASR